MQPLTTTTPTALPARSAAHAVAPLASLLFVRPPFRRASCTLWVWAFNVPCTVPPLPRLQHLPATCSPQPACLQASLPACLQLAHEQLPCWFLTNCGDAFFGPLIFSTTWPCGALATTFSCLLASKTFTPTKRKRHGRSFCYYGICYYFAKTHCGLLLSLCSHRGPIP